MTDGHPRIAEEWIRLDNPDEPGTTDWPAEELRGRGVSSPKIRPRTAAKRSRSLWEQSDEEMEPKKVKTDNLAPLRMHNHCSLPVQIASLEASIDCMKTAGSSNSALLSAAQSQINTLLKSRPVLPAKPSKAARRAARRVALATQHSIDQAILPALKGIEPHRSDTATAANGKDYVGASTKAHRSDQCVEAVHGSSEFPMQRHAAVDAAGGAVRADHTFQKLDSKSSLSTPRPYDQQNRGAMKDEPQLRGADLTRRLQDLLRSDLPTSLPVLVEIGCAWSFDTRSMSGRMTAADYKLWSTLLKIVVRRLALVSDYGKLEKVVCLIYPGPFPTNFKPENLRTMSDELHSQITSGRNKSRIVIEILGTAISHNCPPINNKHVLKICTIGPPAYLPAADVPDASSLLQGIISLDTSVVDLWIKLDNFAHTVRTKMQSLNAMSPITVYFDPWPMQSTQKWIERATAGRLQAQFNYVFQSLSTVVNTDRDIIIMLSAAQKMLSGAEGRVAKTRDPQQDQARPTTMYVVPGLAFMLGPGASLAQGAEISTYATKLWSNQSRGRHRKYGTRTPSE